MNTAKLKKWDVVDFIKSDADIVGFLNAALEEQDSEFFNQCLKDAVRAKNIMQKNQLSGKIKTRV